MEKVEIRKLPQEQIDEIHKRGNLTPEEELEELLSLGVCLPGDAMGSAAWRCEKYGTCENCLTEIANQKDEWTPFKWFIPKNSAFDYLESSEENTCYSQKQDNQRKLEQKAIREQNKIIKNNQTAIKFIKAISGTVVLVSAAGLSYGIIDQNALLALASPVLGGTCLGAYKVATMGLEEEIAKAKTKIKSYT